MMHVFEVGDSNISVKYLSSGPELGLSYELPQ